ncbi:pyridoxal-phosphate dependent enzyme [Aquabacterium sp. A7-Y]|uniref:threonine ammonia-lyase n=1 Tax=Aquabacterium sp. A7-Y TaxID=1349605 RepID=UPI00223D2E82|nr:pyridoxal-phosphate dependent enzyme [Aquabacterium sp. A7-Y]MCW7542107.1 pyridoxal-phosphate dependent enzyme [Aquabacterium sp. A7-Y]
MSAVVTDTPPAAVASPYPSLAEIRATAARLEGKVLHTPVWRWQTGVVADSLHPDTEVWLKLELFQRTGTFKLRGALNNLAALDAEALRRGVVAASAGNHAIAAAYAARVAGCHAKVAMPRHASPARISACRAEGAEVLLTDTVHDAFELAQRLVAEEGRTLVHPFDGPLTAQGTGTLGLELVEQLGRLDAVVVPVGGGGLCGGVAAAIKQLQPACRVYGVEPFGADAMFRSFEAGEPARLERVDTVADSLGAPYALPYSWGVCRRFVDQIVRVDDEALCRAMHALFRDMKLAVEPAAAAATAALLGPLRAQLDGQRVALIVCGSNIDATRHAELLARGAAS